MTKVKDSREAKQPATKLSSKDELNAQELEKVSGGKGCASGEHIKETTITVRP